MYIVVEFNISTGNYRVHREYGSGDIPVFPTEESAWNHVKVFNVEGMLYYVCKMESVS